VTSPDAAAAPNPEAGPDLPTHPSDILMDLIVAFLAHPKAGAVPVAAVSLTRCSY